MNLLDAMKTEHQLRVEEFMKKAKQNLPERPTEPSSEVRILRAKLILEECLETIWKGLGVKVYRRLDEHESIEIKEEGLQFAVSSDLPFDMIELIDGCMDISVVTTGTLSACGVPDKPFLELVDQNNLDKFGPGHSWREDGKLIKPPGHKPPDIQGTLDKVIRNQVSTGCIYDVFEKPDSRQVYYENGIPIGDFVCHEDGFWYFWPTPDRQGAWAGHALFDLFKRLENLNIAWETQLQDELTEKEIEEKSEFFEGVKELDKILEETNKTTIKIDAEIIGKKVRVLPPKSGEAPCPSAGCSGIVEGFGHRDGVALVGVTVTEGSFGRFYRELPPDRLQIVEE